MLSVAFHPHIPQRYATLPVEGGSEAGTKRRTRKWRCQRGQSVATGTTECGRGRTRTPPPRSSRLQRGHVAGSGGAGGVAMGPRAVPSLPRELNRRNLSGRAGPPDPHAILGVPPGASPAEIRAAFLARCKEVHPDGDPSDPSRHGRFLLLAEAYGALSQPRPRPPPAGPAHRPRPPPAGPAHRAHSPPRSDPNSRYWQQFRPPGRPRGPPPYRLLGLCLLVGALGAAGHALAYRYVAGAHAEFLDERDRELRAVYERARSRAGSREEVLRRLREARGRARGRAGP